MSECDIRGFGLTVQYTVTAVCGDARGARGASSRKRSPSFLIVIGVSTQKGPASGVPVNMRASSSSLIFIGSAALIYVVAYMHGRAAGPPNGAVHCSCSEQSRTLILSQSVDSHALAECVLHHLPTRGVMHGRLSRCLGRSSWQPPGRPSGTSSSSSSWEGSATAQPVDEDEFEEGTTDEVASALAKSLDNVVSEGEEAAAVSDTRSDTLPADERAAKMLAAIQEHIVEEEDAVEANEASVTPPVAAATAAVAAATPDAPAAQQQAAPAPGVKHAEPTDDVEVTTEVLRSGARALATAQLGAPRRRYRWLSVDYHIATAQDVGHTLKELGQTFVEKSLSGACGRRKTCAQAHELAPLTKDSAFTLCPQPHALRRAAFEALRGSEMMQSTDSVVCSHPAALCEVWLPFNKSILLIVTANLELARENPMRWREWLQTIVAMSKAPRAVLAANNRYDQAYVEHFTGVRPLYLPTLANYMTARYLPIPGQPVLVARSHHELGRQLLRDLRKAAKGHPGLHVSSIEEAYPGNAAGGGYEYTQLASHPAVIVVPYTKSTMTFFELYRMGIPIFVPSLALLVRWEQQRHIMSERVYWKQTPSPLLKPSTPDPNSLQDRAALEHWLRLCDYYVYPHVQYFESADDLAAKLASADFAAIAAKMRRHSDEMQPIMRAKWRSVMRKLFHNRPSGSWPTPRSGGFDNAIKQRFGLDVSVEEPDCARLSAPELGQWN